MLNPGKYCFYVIAIVMSVTVLSSCGGSHKATTSAIATVPVHKTLDAKQKEELTNTYFEANKEKMLGNYDKALAMFNECLTMDPATAAADYQIADILEFYKQPDSALVYARRAASIDPSNVWYQDLYAQCLQEKSRYKEMIPIYQNLVAAHPSNQDYYYKLAMAQIETGDLDKAADTYNQLEQQQGGYTEEITKEKVKIYERTKEYSKAEVQIQRLIAHDSINIENYDMLGDMYELEGKSDKAFDLYIQMEKFYPHEPSIHLSLAEYYRAKHNEQDSYRELYAAFIEPTLDIDTEVRILLSFYSLSNGHDSLQNQAELLCSAMVKAHPDNAKAHTMYGDFLSRSGTYKDSREQYRITLTLDSSKFAIWEQLMGLDIQLNDFDDLAKVSDGAISLFPNQPLSYLYNGVAKNEQKKYNEAAASLNKGMDNVVNDNTLMSQFCSTLGDTYNSMKRYAASDSAYELALKINPNDENVLNNYSYYLSERDTNLAKAEAMSKRANEISSNSGTYQDTYAWILYKSGNYKDARVWEEKAMNNGGGKDTAVLEHYGDILFKLGDKDNAVLYWHKAQDAGSTSTLLNKKIQDKQLYDK